MSVAAGFVLNIQDNAAKATVEGNAALRAVRAPGVEENEDEDEEAKIYEQDLNGTVRVLSRNRTIADVKADASASNGSVGVGVAVAINIVDIQNIARVGGGASILADENVDVRAAVLVGEKEEEDEDDEQTSEEDGRSALQIELENALKNALDKLMDKLGLSQYDAVLSVTGGISAMIAQIAGAFTNEMLAKDTGIGDALKNIKSFKDIPELLSDNINAAEEVINQIPAMVKASLNEILKAAVGEDTLELVKSLKDGSLMAELFDTNGLEKAPIEIINTTLNVQ